MPLCARQWEYRGKHMTVLLKDLTLKMGIENSAGIRIQSDGLYDRLTIGERHIQDPYPTQLVRDRENFRKK